MRITPDLLQAAVGCTAERADRFAAHLDAACEHYSINTHARLSAFLAQIGHESGSFTWAREVATGDAYEGRKNLGNVQPGDGPRYKGRGLIQITGRDNYRQTTKRLLDMGGPDFEDRPELLEDPRWAAWSAADWWDSRKLNDLADAGEFDAITKRINGGQNGRTDRLARWERAKAALAPYVAPVDDTPAVADPVRPQTHPASEWDMQNPAPAPATKKERPMAPFVIPAVIELAKLIPRLGSMFGGSDVAQRNTAAAGVVVDAVVSAVGAANAQQAVEKVQADPAAREAATKAVEGVWYQISEASGGGIKGAGERDAAMQAAGSIRKSASFWVALMLLPLVYLLVLSLIGVVGTASWSDDVRAGLAGSLISAIIGGLVGYYYGQSTSRNRTGGQP